MKPTHLIAVLATSTCLTSAAMADTLTRYSERGGDYVRTLKQMMRANDLPQLERARLRNDRRPIVIVNSSS